MTSSGQAGCDMAPGDALTLLQSYDALIEFVVARMRTDPASVGGLLIELSYGELDESGVPFAGDQRAWYDWVDAVCSVMEGTNDHTRQF